VLHLRWFSPAELRHEAKDRMEWLGEVLGRSIRPTFLALDGMGYRPTNLPPGVPARTY